MGYKVECVGYATIHFSGNESRTVFGTPTQVISSGNKSFTIQEEDGSTLQISPYDNQVVFNDPSLTEEHMNPEELNTVRERGQLDYQELGVHSFNLDAEVCFSHTDVAGNIFNVSYEGGILTEQPDTHIVQHLDHFYKQNEVSKMLKFFNVNR